MKLNEIVMRIIGPVQPTGDSGVDRERLANMKTLTTLVDQLLSQIDLAASCADRPEMSIRAIGIHAKEFLKDIKDA